MSEMTSVLNHGGLNYQLNNPLRIEITRLRADVTDLRSITDAQKAEIGLLKAQLAVVDKKIKELAAAAGTAGTSASTSASVAAPTATPV